MFDDVRNVGMYSTRSRARFRYDGAASALETRAKREPDRGKRSLTPAIHDRSRQLPQINPRGPDTRHTSIIIHCCRPNCNLTPSPFPNWGNFRSRYQLEPKNMRTTERLKELVMLRYWKLEVFHLSPHSSLFFLYEKSTVTWFSLFEVLS